MRKINVHRAHSMGLIWFSVTFGFMSRFIGVWQLLLVLCVFCAQTSTSHLAYFFFSLFPIAEPNIKTATTTMAKEFYCCCYSLRFQRKANFIRLFVWCSAADWSNVRMNHHHFSSLPLSGSCSFAPHCCFNHMRFDTQNGIVENAYSQMLFAWLCLTLQAHVDTLSHQASSSTQTNPQNDTSTKRTSGKL